VRLKVISLKPLYGAFCFKELGKKKRCEKWAWRPFFICGAGAKHGDQSRNYT
jgi:hypothetical protein